MAGYLAMSDEDFMKNHGSGDPLQSEVQTEAPVVVEAQAEEPVAETPVITEEPAQETEPKTEVEAPLADPAGSATPTPVAEATPPANTESAPAPTAPAKPEGDAAKPGEPAKEAPSQGATPDYKTFYEQVMKPFKANGRTVELKDPAEAVQLMQMGANYTRKMQELAPAKKILMMLEANGLLDEGKLSFLIDVEKKNPEAIKKLVKDAGIDPMEMDTSVEPKYTEGNHRVSDKEAAFSTALDEIKSDPAGVETLETIRTEWDQASKEVLYNDPAALKVIHAHRENGIYAKISTEVNRQKVLGLVPPTVPFIEAYRIIGDQMVKANAFDDLAPQTPAAPAPPVPVATRVAAPKPAVVNNDKASAAASTRVAPPKQNVVVNPLAMSDEAFMKQMEGRV